MRWHSWYGVPTVLLLSLLLKTLLLLIRRMQRIADHAKDA
jgi:hypothetical protein